MTESLTIGIIGLGVMGLAYARNLRKAGFAVAGHDPLPPAMAALADCGGVPMDGPADLAAAVDIILLALPSVAALEQAMEQARPALRSGNVLAEMSTLPLEAKQAARSLAEAAGAVLLDCPVSGTGAQAATGDLVVFSSGEAAAKARILPVFRGFARDVKDVGDFGAGMKMKYVANLLVSIHNLASAEALLLAERSGLDLQMVFDAIRSGAGTSRMFEVRGPMMVAESYEPATMSMGLYQKDLALIMDHARDVGCPVPLMAATLPFYSAAIAQGRARQDTAALFAVLRQLSRKAAP